MKKRESRVLKERRAVVWLKASELASAIAGRPGLSFQSKPRIPLDAELVAGEFNPYRCSFQFLYQTENGSGFQMSEGHEPPEREFPLDVADMENPENLRALVADYLEDHPEEVVRLGAMALVIIEEVHTALATQQMAGQDAEQLHMDR